MLSIAWEHVYSIIVKCSDKTGYRLDIVGADNEQIRSYCTNVLIYASKIHPQVTLPIWLNWLETREIKYRLTFTGSKWRLAYWTMRFLHKLLTYEFGRQSFAEYIIQCFDV